MPCSVSAARLYNRYYVIDIEPTAHDPLNEDSIMAKGNNSQNKDKKKAKAAAPRRIRRLPPRRTWGRRRRDGLRTWFTVPIPDQGACAPHRAGARLSFEPLILDERMARELARGFTRLSNFLKNRRVE